MNKTKTAQLRKNAYRSDAHYSVLGMMEGYAFWSMEGKTPTEIRAIADRIDQVADFFQQNPDMRTKGVEINNAGLVCAIGAVNYSRKIGLKFNPFASKNCNAKDTTRVMSACYIVDLNDSYMPAEQFRNYMRGVANVLRTFADAPERTERTLAQTVRNDGYFKRLAKAYNVNADDLRDLASL